MILADNERERIVDFMKRSYGVNLKNKDILIAGRLGNKLENLGFASYAQFMDRVELAPGGEEATLLVNCLTTNHTYFMRESVHFEFMTQVALPEIKEREQRSHDIRIWSAAASSGEEAYTAVMTIKDFFGIDAPNWDTRILATDISSKQLDVAREGIYRAEALTNLPERWIKHYFVKEDEEYYRVRPETRSEVIFRHFNLMEPFTFKKKFHIIFLRNVMIYFDEPTKLTLLKKIYDYLEPGGYLFVGTTETIDKDAVGFMHVRPSIYTK